MAFFAAFADAMSRRGPQARVLAPGVSRAIYEQSIKFLDRNIVEVLVAQSITPWGRYPDHHDQLQDGRIHAMADRISQLEAAQRPGQAIHLGDGEVLQGHRDTRA